VTSLVSNPRSAWLIAALLLLPAGLRAQVTPPTTPGTSAPLTAPASSNQGVVVDRVIAVVNSDLILESDVQEELRFAAFEPFRDRSHYTREQAVERLIDRDLILQQAKQQAEDAVTPAEVQTQLDELRKDIPACKQFHCETADGWAKFAAAQGFTVEEVNKRWQQRMETLKFVELRFRMGIRIEPADIKTFYDKTLVPEYTRQHATPPKIDAVSDRIQEVLLEQRVTSLLDDWLKSLRAQGSVRIIKPDEVTP